MRIASGGRIRRHRRKRADFRRFTALAAVALTLVIGILLTANHQSDATAEPADLSEGQPLSRGIERTASAEEGLSSVLPEASAAAMSTPETAPPRPVQSQPPLEAPGSPLYDDPAVRARWSSGDVTDPKPGDVRMLPVLDYAKNSTDMVAITIDDCFRFDNIQRILDLADEYGAKLTFFPIGYQIPKQPDIWKEILDRGHEIENHSYHHLLVGSLTDEELYKTITMEERALNEALGVNYKMKYFRPRGGSARKDPRLSLILHDLGYQGIASWGLSGGQDVRKLIRKSNGGHVVLFHTADEDLKKLKKFIPAMKAKGLKMVTLNELYGKPANVITPLPPEGTLAPEASGA
jgi:peptidoglycan/xylan/chitin deacetylase (PgdA/CDA1 family)